MTNITIKPDFLYNTNMILNIQDSSILEILSSLGIAYCAYFNIKCVFVFDLNEDIFF